MKSSAFLLSFLFFIPASVNAQQMNVRDECYRNTEEYIPGYTTPDGRYVQGRVRSRRVSVPCGGYNNTSSLPKCNRNRTIFNGLLGGSIAASVSKKDAYGWAIPLGVVLGAGSAKVNCR